MEGKKEKINLDYHVILKEKTQFLIIVIYLIPTMLHQ